MNLPYHEWGHLFQSGVLHVAELYLYRKSKQAIHTEFG